MPCGVHGSGPVDAHDQLAQVDRVQAVDVLGRVDPQEGGLVVEARSGTGTGIR